MLSITTEELVKTSDELSQVQSQLKTTNEHLAKAKEELLKCKTKTLDCNPKIQQSTVSRYFNKWLDILYHKLSVFVSWPEREQPLKTTSILKN